MIRSILTGFFLACFAMGSAWAQTSPDLPSTVELISAEGDELFVRVHVEGIRLMPIADGRFVATVTEGTPMLKQGAPDLFKLATSFLADPDRAMSWEVISTEFEDIADVDIAPSLGNVYRDVDPATLPRVKGAPYEQDAFWPADLVALGTPFVHRGLRGQSAHFHALQFNPITSTLRVHHTMDVRFYATDEPGANPASPLASTTLDAPMRDLLNRRYINFETAGERYDLIDELGSILVISDEMYFDEIAPWVEWKREKGFLVEVINVANAGDQDVSAVQAFVADAYAETPYTYLVLVGDEDQVPSELVVNGGGPGFCDPCYGYIDGDDSYPEMLVGRFLGHNEAEIATIVARTLEYEKAPYTGADWFSQAVGIGSSEGAGNGDDGESDWQHNNGIKEDLTAYGFTAVWEMYDGSHGGDSPTGGETADGSGSPVSLDLQHKINDGVSLINYTGHGWHSGIVTTNFQNGDISNLTNVGMYPFFIIVGCCVGDFDEADGSGDCLGEVWSKSTDGSGNPTGGIGGAFSSVLQSWAPPMEGQDEMNKLIAEEGDVAIRHSLAGILFHGCGSMMEEYGSQGDQMTDTWCLFGDPSAVLRTQMPDQLSVGHEPVVFLGVSEVTVDCLVEDALVAITQNGALLGRALVSGGQATVSFDEPISDPGVLVITGTAYNYIPYQSTIDAVPAAGPYVVDESVNVNDVAGNGNGLAENAEALLLDVSLENVGIETANGVVAILSTSSPLVVITDDEEAYGDIEAGSVPLIEGAYGVTVADEALEDGMTVAFDLAITDSDGNTWNGGFTMTLHAPVLSLAECTLIDENGDGVLDPNETATVEIEVYNDGSVAAPMSSAGVVGIEGPVEVLVAYSDLGVIPADGSAMATFEVQANPDAPQGSEMQLSYDATSGWHNTFSTCAQPVNIIMETWESGTDTIFPWSYDGVVDWFIVSNEAYQGASSMRSGNIADNLQTVLVLDLVLETAGDVSFAKKVSSEGGYDFLKFRVDGLLYDSWSGEEDWAVHSYALNAGEHTLKWIYDKDFSVDEGEDAAWVDNIVLPPHSYPDGVSEVAGYAPIGAFPNPATEAVTLTGLEAGSEIVVFDAIGRIVFQLNTNAERALLSTATWSPGWYLVSQQQTDGRALVKLLIQ